MRKLDENGNQIAEVVGGPDDGGAFFCRDFEHGDQFVPIKTASHRPIYKLWEPDATKEARFVFCAFEPNEGGA